MKKIIINGNKPLFGEITPQGSKNAALPILFATILIDGVSEIRNLPDIGDVRITLKILESLGAVITRAEDVTYVDTQNLNYAHPPKELVSKLRASTYLIGAMLSRFGKCPIPEYGGCAFAPRPIDMHLCSMRSLGANISDGQITAERLSGNVIRLGLPSVGATVNSILASVCADGETTILGRARESHIDNLIDFLLSAGAEIENQEKYIKIRGRRLHGGRVTVIGDPLEAASYLAAGLITGGLVKIKNPPEEDFLRDVFSTIGAETLRDGDRLFVEKGRNIRYSLIKASPYPGFPTDLQPIFAPLLARFSGGVIEDTVFPTRFGYLNALKSLGIESRVSDGRAYISPSEISFGNVDAPDLRGGMAAVLSALCADGVSVISSADIILRGYEGLGEKLTSICADAYIIDE